MRIKILLLGIIDLILITLLVLIFSKSAFASPVTNEEFEDIVLLAKVISGEAGADWCSDEMRYGVGSVIINRLNHEEFPDTMEEVIYQEGQYGCLHTKEFKDCPTEHCIGIASELYLYGSKYPANVVYQSNQPLGSGTYRHIQNMYFSYK